MTDMQLTLIALILNGLCLHVEAIVPYRQWGCEVGRCRFCGAIGEAKSDDIVWTHTDTCILVLNAQLQRLLQGEKDAAP